MRLTTSLGVSDDAIVVLENDSGSEKGFVDVSDFFFFRLGCQEEGGSGVY